MDFSVVLKMLVGPQLTIDYLLRNHTHVVHCHLLMVFSSRRETSFRTQLSRPVQA